MNSRLNCFKLPDEFGISVPHWRLALSTVLEALHISNLSFKESAQKAGRHVYVKQLLQLLCHEQDGPGGLSQDQLYRWLALCCHRPKCRDGWIQLYLRWNLTESG